MLLQGTAFAIAQGAEAARLARQQWAQRTQRQQLLWMLSKRRRSR